jgi:hypothetical protein
MAQQSHFHCLQKVSKFILRQPGLLQDALYWLRLMSGPRSNLPEVGTIEKWPINCLTNEYSN